MNNYNCETCLYANFVNDDNLVMCDRRLLYDGREIYIETDKIGSSCPCHSDRFVEEWRGYRSNKDVRMADDSCEICGRLYNDMNEDNYEIVVEEVIIKEKDENGKEVEITNEYAVRKCKICIDKGRNLFG